MPVEIDENGVDSQKRPTARFPYQIYDLGKSLLHRRIAVDAFDRALLARMDGTRTQADLVAGVAEEITAGRLSVEVDGAPRTEPEVLLEVAQQKLERLARAGFVVGLVPLDLLPT